MYPKRQQESREALASGPIAALDQHCRLYARRVVLYRVYGPDGVMRTIVGGLMRE